jgi:D-alanyl-D-alanine dipeptidase
MRLACLLCVTCAWPACSRPEPSGRAAGSGGAAASRSRTSAQATSTGEQAARVPATPPGGSSEDPAALVDIATVAPSIRIEIRYATANNFTGVAVYPVARCLLRRDAAQRLARVQEALSARGLGLKVWDCYRPFSVQRRLWKLVPDERYVARPVAGADGAPVEGSKHNRGAAVDLTLVRADGSALEMPTDYDDFSERAHRGDDRASASARRNAALLEQVMVAQGFEPLPTEWWHFDAPGWQRYPLSDRPLGEARTKRRERRPEPDAGAAPALP